MVKKITKIGVIAKYINDYGKKYYLKEFAFLLNKPHQTIKPYIEELVKEGILTKDKRRKIVEFSLNFKGKMVYNYLVLAEKEKLIEKLEAETLLKILYEKLFSYLEDNIFIIFGSSANNVEKGSDIDLLVVGKANITRLINEFEEVYNKKIHKVQTVSLKTLTPVLIKEIYKKHIILNNTEQVVRFFWGQYEQNKLV